MKKQEILKNKRGLNSHIAVCHRSKYSSIPQWILLLFIFFAFWGSYRLSEIEISLLWSKEGLRAWKEFLGGMFPPELSWDFLGYTLKPTLDTLYISIAGTLLGVFLGFPLSLLATSSLTYKGVLYLSDKCSMKTTLRFMSFFGSRGLLNLLRSIPELIWALVFVRAVGIGPLPGVLALGVAYAGILGKLYSEILDSVSPKPIDALYSGGASKGHIILYGYLPMAFPDLLAYTLYRWECGIRSSVVLGFVGAGGIGQEIEVSMRMFNYHEVATLMIILIVLVGIVDTLSSVIRRRLV